jgi:hypothetical protein
MTGNGSSERWPSMHFANGPVAGSSRARIIGSAWGIHHADMPSAGSKRRFSQARHTESSRDNACACLYHSAHHAHPDPAGGSGYRKRRRSITNSLTFP